MLIPKPKQMLIPKPKQMAALLCAVQVNNKSFLIFSMILGSIFATCPATHIQASEPCKIAAYCVAAATLYGVINGSMLAKVIPHYVQQDKDYTGFKKLVWDNNMLAGAYWGAINSCGIGAIMSLPMILAIRCSNRPLPASSIIIPGLITIGCIAAFSWISGGVGYIQAHGDSNTSQEQKEKKVGNFITDSTGWGCLIGGTALFVYFGFHSS